MGRRIEMTGHAALLGVVSCVLALSLGCSKADSTRFDISGEITFNDALVPAGIIYFSPDTSEGNDGPEGHAEIHNGRYDTSRTRTGSPGGRVHVRIEGFDGKPTGDFIYGKPLFFYETTIELPRATTTKNFVVPPDAAKNVPAQSGPGP